MKLTARLCSVLVLAILIAPIVLFQGCGNNKTIPDGSTITIMPDSIALNLTAGSHQVVALIKVVVRYADGTPIPYANLVVTGGFAAPETITAYQFYWKPGGDTVLDNTAVPNGFKPQTDKNGVYDFSIVVDSPSAFSDTIYVTSGSVVGSATIAMTTT